MRAAATAGKQSIQVRRRSPCNDQISGLDCRQQMDVIGLGGRSGLPDDINNVCRVVRSVAQQNQPSCECTPKNKEQIFIPGCGELLGYFDVLQPRCGLNASIHSPDSIFRCLDLLQRNKYIYTYRETLLSPAPVATTTTSKLTSNASNVLENYSIVRIYVYLIETGKSGRISGMYHCDTASRSALLQVLCHLKYDWQKGWAGLLTPRRTDCKFCFGQRPDAGSPPNEGRRTLYSINDLLKCKSKSRCFVIGCDKHVDLERVPRQEQNKLREYFSLLHRFNRLEPPSPVDLVGLTVARGNVPILNLTTEIFDNIASFCNGTSLDNFGRTSRAGHAYVFDAVPGIKLSLMPHQRAALRWMLLRENRLALHQKINESNDYEDPFQIRLYPFHPSTTYTKAILVNLATLEFEYIKEYFSNCKVPKDIDTNVEGARSNNVSPPHRTEPIADADQRTVDPRNRQNYRPKEAPQFSCAGGLFCDDPGLGKTITALALILRTKSQEPILRPHMKVHTTDPGSYDSMEERFAKRKSYYALQNQAHQTDFEQTYGLSSTLRQSPRLRRSSSQGEKQEIFLASTTLIVVPFTLVDHWVNQIKSHTAKGSLTFKAITPLSGVNEGHLNNVRDPRHSAHEIPPPHILRKYDIIITTFHQLSREWVVNKGRSNLLKVHWLRVILDEGHELGKSVQLTNRLEVSCLLKCDRRWIMTGTPTPKNTASIRHKDAGNRFSTNEIRYLQPLLRFLRVYPFHFRRESVSLFRRLISEPYESGDGYAAQRLDLLLDKVMIRSNKRKLPSFPSMKEHNIVLDFNEVHGKSYCQLVEVIQRNLMLADWFDRNHKESLLNPKSSKYAAQTAENVRLSCCVAGNIHLPLSDIELVETLDELQYGFSLDHVIQSQWKFRNNSSSLSKSTVMEGYCALCGVNVEKPRGIRGKERLKAIWYSHANTPGHRQRTFARVTPVISDERRAHIGEALRNGCKCERCKAFSLQPIITPCGCLVCVWCVKLSKLKCSLCGQPYKMQSVDDEGRTDVNPNPQWSVPIELIELQPAYSSVYTAGFGAQGTGGWRLDYTSLGYESSKIKFLLQRLRVILDSFRWQPEHINPLTKGRWVHINSKNRSKRKIIIFSQFLQHFLAIEQALYRQNIQFARVYLNSNAEKVREIQRFERDPNVPVLLMDVSGAVGLDLHFVSHVFLMDPIPDVSLEEQIIARAWRMGAKETVHVYRLVMKDSVEHTLLRLRKFGNSHEIISDEDASTITNEEGQIPSKTDTEYVLLNMKRVHIDTANQGIEDSSPSFIKSDSFIGAKPNYIFKHGAQGLGYYMEVSDRKTAAVPILKKSSFNYQAGGTSRDNLSEHHSVDEMNHTNKVTKRRNSSICDEEKTLIEFNEEIYKKLNAKRFVGIFYDCADRNRKIFGKILSNGHIDADTGTSSWSREGENMTPFQWAKNYCPTLDPKQFAIRVIVAAVDGVELKKQSSIQDYIRSMHSIQENKRRRVRFSD